MNLEKKMELLNIVESYWDLLPPEIQQLILKYRESQTLIEWRESCFNRRLCRDIEDHGHLRIVWFIGPIRCIPSWPKKCECRPRCVFMKIFGYYWNLMGEPRRSFLGYTFCHAIEGCHDVRNGINYQVDPDYVLSVCGLKLF